ncbi:uncharacterized protein THITE_2041100, partial [Thermothielavioides terrestris NRRL 8126]
LYKLGFVIFLYDDGAFINTKLEIAILYYINDLIIIGPNINDINNITNEASQYIKLQSLEEIDTFLSINIIIDRKKKEIHIHQIPYINSILEKYKKNNLYLSNTLIDLNNKLYKNQDIKIYQQEIGSLLYLALKTRLDIAFAV